MENTATAVPKQAMALTSSRADLAVGDAVEGEGRIDLRGSEEERGRDGGDEGDEIEDAGDQRRLPDRVHGCSFVIDVDVGDVSRCRSR
jgi:hypothetical protein